MLTEKQLTEIRERAERATDGPWVYEETSFELDEVNDCYGNTVFHIGSYEVRNAEFIGHARGDIPMLLAEIERLHGQLAYYEEILGR